jgi:predicted nucleic acid-binding protein
MAKIIVSNTGPIISLEKLGDGFDFIRKLYDKILLPDAVLQELAGDNFLTPSDYLEAHHIEELVEIRQVLKISAIPEIERLDEGEKHAISLAYQLGLPLLIEETIGRQIASAAGIQISSIAGQIIKAFKENLIGNEEAAHKLHEMFSAGRINRKIYNALIAALK